LGVWSFRRGDLEDAAFWFVNALRLHIESESSSLSSTDAALGINGYILLNNNTKEDPSDDSYGREKSGAEPSFVQEGCKDEHPPLSTGLSAIKTSSGQPIAAHKSSNNIVVCNLTDIECVNRCNDIFWEPTIYNLGQSYRKLRRYADAIVCFERCSSLNPVSFVARHRLSQN
jgi:tetratricopeptide (TPR) repeat protein